MTNQLALRYEFNRDPADDFGWLEAKVQAKGFSGTNGYWVQWQDVMEFAEDLSRHPIVEGRPVEREWWYTENGQPFLVTRICISAEDKTGHLTVAATVADYYDPRLRCETIFRTNYPEVDRFREELKLVMAGKRELAVLLGR